MKPCGASRNESQKCLGWCPIPQVNHRGMKFGGHHGPDVVAVLNDLEVRKNFSDFLTTLADLSEDILGKSLVD